ncbi:MAG TPA: response regulator [Flavitalea sp.]|nr:response regulator [Flavitalea sp.]
MPVNKTILLVDDDADDRMLFTAAFTEAKTDHELIEFENGEQLFQYLDEKIPNTPRLIVMDSHMQKIDGEEACRKLKNNKNFARIPVIVYSGTSSSFQQEPVLKWGANAYVQKPSSYEKTVEIVKSILLLYG